jgi:hypothetical protein
VPCWHSSGVTDLKCNVGAWVEADLAKLADRRQFIRDAPDQSRTYKEKVLPVARRRWSEAICRVSLKQARWSSTTGNVQHVAMQLGGSNDRFLEMILVDRIDEPGIDAEQTKAKKPSHEAYVVTGEGGSLSGPRSAYLVPQQRKRLQRRTKRLPISGDSRAEGTTA